MKIAIVTATYNRKKLLERLYNSLENQKEKNFSWIVIDDGSTDETENYLKNLKSSFRIYYKKQKNGGKARALNNAFNYAEEFDLFIIVDSDDYLLPSASQVIKSKSLEGLADNEIGAVFFRYKLENGELLTRESANDHNETVMSRIDHDSKYAKVDGCVGYFSKTITKYKYPEFEGENYVGPTVIQLLMSEEYKILFTQKVVGVANYQEEGLTKSGRKIRVSSPLSMMVYCHLMQDKKFGLITRLKYGIMANAYFKIAQYKNSDKADELRNTLKVPKMLSGLGKILAYFWLIKFR